MSNFEIGITTRDRWSELDRTLAHLRKYFGDSVVIRVIVDGAENGVPPFIADNPCISDLLVCGERQGLVGRRNQLAERCQAKYLVSVDDDSYPVKGDFAGAVAFLENQCDALALGFPVQNLDMGWQVRPLQSVPYRTRAYIGCAHILNRDRFLRLGGYDERLIQQGEEFNFSARAFVHGYTCWHYPMVQFMHEKTQSARSHSRMHYYGARNKILWSYLYTPTTAAMMMKMGRALCEQGHLAIIQRDGAYLQGIASALRSFSTFKDRRCRMSLTQYSEWLSMPEY